MRIIAIDPGGTTGIATYQKDTYSRAFLQIKGAEEFAAMQEAKVSTCLLPMEDVIKWISHIPSIDLTVIESFATAGRLSKYGLHTIDLVGQVKGYCFAKDIQCVIQTPQSRKSFIILAERLLNKRHSLIHEVDALAHLLQYLNKQGIPLPNSSSYVTS